MRHGRIPIQDEFTHRRDLTPFQKWQLRHGKKLMNVGAGREKSARIDLGLALLSVAAQPGVRLTTEDIAAWCDCSWQAIRQIEQKALRKLRQRLGAEGRELLTGCQ